MEIGGGIIKEKILFVALLVASLIFGGIATASACNVDATQMQSSDTNTLHKYVNKHSESVNYLKDPEKTQKKLANNFKWDEQSWKQKKVSSSQPNTHDWYYKHGRDCRPVNSDTTPSDNDNTPPADDGTTPTDDGTSDNDNTPPADDGTTPTDDGTSDNDNTPPSDNGTVNPPTINNSARAIVVEEQDALKLDGAKLKAMGVTDVYVKANFYGEPYYQDLLPAVKANLGDSGIKLHAWIMCFMTDYYEQWIVPQKNADGTYTYDQQLENILELAKTMPVDGINLDYIRYNTEAGDAASRHSNGAGEVALFVQKVYEGVKAINPNLIVSVNVFPDPEYSPDDVGQDYKLLAPYVDVFIPMIYKGNWNEDTAWVAERTKVDLQYAVGKPVMPCILSYVSDDNQLALPASELINDAKTVIANGGYGVAIYQYGILDPAFTFMAV